MRTDERPSGREAGAAGEAEARLPADAGGTAGGSPLSWEAENPRGQDPVAPGERELAEDGPERWADTEDGSAAAAGHVAEAGGRGRVASHLRRLPVTLTGRPRLRALLFCLLGLLSGGLAGASLAALHLALFEPDPASPETEEAGATTRVKVPAAAPAVRPGPEDGRELRPVETADAIAAATRVDDGQREAAELVPAIGGDDAGGAATSDGGDATLPEQVSPAGRPDASAKPVEAAAPPSPRAAAAEGQPADAGTTLSRPVIPEPRAALPSAKLEAVATPAAKPPVPGPAPTKPGPGAGAAGPASPKPPPPAPRGSRLALADPAAGQGEAVDWQGLYERAHRLQAEGKSEAAIATFGRAVAADPSHAAAFYDWGYALQKAGRVEAAIEKYRRALELEPGHAYAHYNLGYLLQQKGELAGAVDSYREAARLDGDNPYVFYNWGEILNRQGDIQGAIDLYRRASRLAPDRPPGLDARARLEQLEQEGRG